MKVLITGGPTNEKIDEVMKITNMSTGSLAKEMTRILATNGHDVTLIITNGVELPQELNQADELMGKVNVVRMESTEDLIRVISTLPDKESYDAVIHSSAVADYKPEFTYRAEDIAMEILDNMFEEEPYIDEASIKSLYSVILRTLTNPKCKVNDTSKISSYEKNLIVKLGLTSKVISTLRKQFPTALICGFKLLEGVSQEELITAAEGLIKKNNVDLIFANDLAKLNAGDQRRLLVNKQGFTGKYVNGAQGILNAVIEAIVFKKD